MSVGEDLQAQVITNLESRADQLLIPTGVAVRKSIMNESTSFKKLSQDSERIEIQETVEVMAGEYPDCCSFAYGGRRYPDARSVSMAILRPLPLA